MGLPKMSTNFIKPYLSINNHNQVAYIRDIYSWEEIELVYSDDLKDLDCQLLFYNLKIFKKISNLWHDVSFSKTGTATYYLQSI